MDSKFAGYRRTLVATDFSPPADAAVRQAIWLARRTGGTTVVATALPDLRRVVHSASVSARLDILYGEGNVLRREVREPYETKLRRVIADLDALDLDVQYEVLLGEPYVELTYTVLAGGHDLVLAGTRGMAAWEQVLVGSTARRLIRKCPASVWIVKAEHTHPPRKVLAATDFSDVSGRAVSQALWLAQQADAEFHLLHVSDSADLPEDWLARVGAGSTLQSEIEAAGKRRLEEFAASLPLESRSLTVHHASGTPWKELTSTAREIGADLIAMGTVGRSGVKGLLLGNTAEKVLSTCDCSILAVKPADFVSPLASSEGSAT